MQTLRSSSQPQIPSATRISFLFAIALALVTRASAQDPGMQAAMAAQQASMQAQQAAAQAQMDAQQASANAAAAAAVYQQAIANAQNNTIVAPVVTAAPTFSVHANKVIAGTTVRLKTRSHYATIYYTTNGWAPTERSNRYTGPITITRTTLLQAIAVTRDSGVSLISSALYTVPGSQPHPEPLPLSIDGLLRAGTSLHLVTADTVSSKTAQVGDVLKLALNQDVKIGDSIVLPKGTPVEATITQADRSGHAGVPGDLSFEVHGLTVDGKQIPLNGGETMEGRNHYTRNLLILIPVLGDATLAFHGDEAQIVPGMRLTAEVSADTNLQPMQPVDQ